MQDIQTEIQTMGRDELIDGVIKKHEKMLEEFYEEFKELDKTVGTYEKDMENMKNSIQKNITDKEINDEKMHFFASKVIVELESIRDSIKDIKQAEFEFTKRDIDNIITNINHLKSPKNAEDRHEKKRNYDDAVSGISGLYVEKDELRKDQMLADLEVMYSSYTEFREIVENEEERRSKLENAADITNEKKRHEWLKRRIESHEEALKYWQAEKADTGVKVA